MATMRPTPRNELLGLLSDAYQWMQSPERAQQMQGFAGLLGTTGVPQTVERMAYGEPLTNIGRANVPLLKPETADALMTVAPFAPKGMKMIRATEGMPVGMSIKDVGKGMVKEIPKKSSLLDMTRTPSEAEIKKMSREDLIDWLQNNDPNGQYMDPTPNPSISMYRTGKGYAVENADSGDVFEFTCELLDLPHWMQRSDSVSNLILAHSGVTIQSYYHIEKIVLDSLMIILPSYAANSNASSISASL